MSGHIHIDPVGGLSGDMFLAAMLSAFPDAEAPIQADLRAAGLSAHVTVSTAKVVKSGFAALQAEVAQHPEAPPTRHWRDIRAFLSDSALRTPVKSAAIAIFEALAIAEAACHDVAVEDVHFHEVADWDSLADIVAAASLIDLCGVESWSASALPLGRGRVRSQHGLIPVPAPATAELLKGFRFIDDGIEGERITPTGAAILRHLAPQQDGPPELRRLVASGAGAGRRDLEGAANICRLLVFETSDAAPDRVCEIGFEIDDMTPEEISVALDRIRDHSGVLDAGYTLGYGKKGRIRYGVAVLAERAHSEAVAELCLTETSTLGVRVGLADRRILRRSAGVGHELRTKSAHRPGGATTKAESDDLAGIPTLRARRRAAHLAESGDD